MSRGSNAPEAIAVLCGEEAIACIPAESTPPSASAGAGAGRARVGSGMEMMRCAGRSVVVGIGSRSSWLSLVPMSNAAPAPPALSSQARANTLSGDELL